MEKKQVYILSGLPGSGKTTFADNMQQENDNVFVWHQDDKSSKWWTYDRWQHQIIIIDALNLTNDEIIKSILNTKKRLYKIKDWTWTIVRWKENREQCLKNDVGRREISSKHTIQKANFELPDIKKIEQETGIENIQLEEREVVKTSSYMKKIDKSKYHIKGKYLFSEEWLISGTSRDYDSNWSSMCPDDTPEFTELYDLLEEICPDISFLTFRKIQKECVEIITYEDNDYYSTTVNSYYRCNLEKMFEILSK